MQSRASEFDTKGPAIRSIVPSGHSASTYHLSSKSFFSSRGLKWALGTFLPSHRICPLWRTVQLMSVKVERYSHAAFCREAVAALPSLALAWPAWSTQIVSEG